MKMKLKTVKRAKCWKYRNRGNMEKMRKYGYFGGKQNFCRIQRAVSKKKLIWPSVEEELGCPDPYVGGGLPPQPLIIIFDSNSTEFTDKVRELLAHR